MKTKQIIYMALIFIFSINLLSAQESNVKNPDNEAIANKLVNTILKIKPADVVIISGNKDQIDLLSSVYVAVRKAGGHVTVELNLPKAGKRAIMETPIEFMKTTNSYIIFKNRMVDCFISIGSVEYPELYADVPEERLAANREAYVLYNKLNRNFHYRSVSVGQSSGVPTNSFAKSVNADYDEMVSGFWKAVNTDYDKMTKNGKSISDILKPGSNCKISSKSGTNITFKIDKIPVRTNCGSMSENQISSGPSSVWLPAGEVYTCIVPKSANGKIVVPAMFFRGVKIKNLEISVKNGHIMELKAEENEKIIKDYQKMSIGDKDVLSLIDIGINENSKPYKGSDFYSWEMSGLLTMGFGNNAWAGGDNNSNTGTYIHLSNSTLDIDGKAVVKDGKLMLD
ncbi:MAG: aminopeptidase [Bacteroidota bacterium]